VTSLTGGLTLARVVARRDRVRLATWFAAVVLLVLFTAVSTKAIYPTQADLDQAAAASEDNPAALAFNGPAQALDTMGGQVAFQVGAFGLSLVALMSILMVGRLTRAEEDSGRLELVRSMPVGRHAPLAAALVVVGALDVAVGLGAMLCLLACGLPVAGSVVLGVSFSVVGALFLGITAITAQVTENPRVATGMAGGLLGLAFVLRAVGDIGDGTVSWLSPIGWGQKARPYAGERWSPLVLTAVVAGVLVVTAGRLSTRRDFGSGLLRSRGGPAQATASLGGPVGLAMRLGRGTVLWWAVAVAAVGVAYGSVADSIEEFVADNQAIADMIARSGGASLTDSYLATSLLLLALMAAAAALQALSRVHGEEAGGRAEAVLSTAVSRGRWLGSHLLVALCAGVGALGAAGLGIGLTYGIVAGDLGKTPEVVLAAFLYTPAVALLLAVATLLFGIAPRRAALAWLPLIGCAVVGLFGPLLRLPAWLVGLSPFERTPQLPAQHLRTGALLAIGALAAALIAAGFAAFRRRDVG
jgi:ABC-2 type transport system permease protein